MLHLVIFFVMQDGQSFSCSISYSSLKCPPQGGILDHLVDTADMINRRLLVYDHMHVPEICVSLKEPRGSDEERGFAITQRS
jgi:hypothetical protein